MDTNLLHPLLSVAFKFAPDSSRNLHIFLATPQCLASQHCQKNDLSWKERELDVCVVNGDALDYMIEKMGDHIYYTTSELVLFNGTPRSAMGLFHKLLTVLSPTGLSPRSGCGSSRS